MTKRTNFMCKASEFAKYVINECLKRNFDLDTTKLQKLLVLMQGTHLSEYDTPIFPEEVLCWKCGVAIKEVNDDFSYAAFEFPKEELKCYIAILKTEEKVVKQILDLFGDKSTFEISQDNRLKKIIYNKEINSIIEKSEIKKIFNITKRD